MRSRCRTRRPALPRRSAITDDPIREKVLEIVAEKTGYPKDMLDLDLDLEADLGIDTVKQAEMFASVRAAFNIPRDQALRLRDFPTLAHVIRFAEERRAAGAAAAGSRAGGRVRAANWPPSRRPTPSRAACQFRRSAPRSACASQPAYRSSPAGACSSCPIVPAWPKH